MMVLSPEAREIFECRYSHLKFMERCWRGAADTFKVGIHTREICRLLDAAFDDLRRGRSTFLVVKVPFRHGKSHIISRYLPPHFLGEFPDREVMLVTYAASLAEGFSRYARALMRSPEYMRIYPEVRVDRTNAGVQQWGVEGRSGSCMASGLGGSITGKGGSLLLLDDYLSSRADAESEVVRNSTWEAFTNDFLTRRAPAAITVVLATPWHVDDIIGRIERRIDPASDEYDADFPKFKVVSFPAMDGDVEIGVRAEGGGWRMERRRYKWLFPERFDEGWYRSQFAALGEYNASALLQCSPTARAGNLVKVENVRWHDDAAEFPLTKYYRVWDLAHTEKQTIKDDPDWTSGTLLAYVNRGGAWELWIKDVARIRAAAPERDAFIRAVADRDGDGVAVAVENSVDSADALANMREIFKGRRSVRAVQTRGDKVARMSYVEPIFEAGNAHALRGAWNLDWLDEVKNFPRGRHDDQVDNLSAGYALCCKGAGRIASGRVEGV